MKGQNQPFLALLALSFALAHPAAAQSIEPFTPPTPPYNGPWILDGSDDGLVYLLHVDTGAGNYQTALYNHSTGTYTYLPGFIDYANEALSGDGTLIAGAETFNIGSYNGYIWTAGTGKVPLGIPVGYTDLAPISVNGNGSVVVGMAVQSDSDLEAFYWTAGTGAVPIGFLPGAPFEYSNARDVSDDGRYIVGGAQSPMGGIEPFIYDRNTSTMTGLGYVIASTYGFANQISGDGSTVVGYNYDGGFNPVAFSWTAGTGSVSLGIPAGFLNSTASIVNYDGSVIFGSGDDGSGYKSLRWTQATGWQLSTDYLASAGIDLTGINFSGVDGINSDGTVLYGSADFGSGFELVIINLASGGMTTPGALEESLATANITSSQMTQVSSGSLSNSLYAAKMLPPVIHSVFRKPATRVPDSVASPISAAGLSPAAGEEKDSFSSIRERLSGYSYGTLGFGQHNDPDNRSANGTTGVRYEISPELYTGFGIVASHSNEDMPFDGKSELSSYGLSTLLSYRGASGARIYGSAFASYLSADITRAYQNGGSIDSSQGESNGFAYGIALHGGWEIPAAHNLTIQPYAELYGTHARLDGYEESGGAFAASVSERNETVWTSRLGAEIRTEIKPGFEFSLRGAWGHTLSGETSSLTVNSLGIGGTFAAAESDQNWAEIGAGAQWTLSDRLILSADASGRSSRTADPSVNLTLGLSYKF